MIGGSKNRTLVTSRPWLSQDLPSKFSLCSSSFFQDWPVLREVRLSSGLRQRVLQPQYGVHLQARLAWDAL